MDHGVVGVMCKVSLGRVVLDMAEWLPIGTGVESCKPCQGMLPPWRSARQRDTAVGGAF